MIHLCYFDESQRSGVVTNPVYQRFGLSTSVNPNLTRNCPELHSPETQRLLAEYAAMLHLWRNPEVDPDPWIGFNAHTRPENTIPVFESREAVQEALSQCDIVGWRTCQFFDETGKKPVTLAEQSEWAHHSSLMGMWKLLMMRGETLPPQFLTQNVGVFGNSWVLSKDNFREYMEWSSPLVKYCLDHPEECIYSHPRSMPVFIERLFIVWYLIYEKKVASTGQPASVLCRNTYCQPEVFTSGKQSELLLQRPSSNTSNREPQPSQRNGLTHPTTMTTPTSRQNDWLNHCRANATSQFGEDGITAQILQLLPKRDRWCVEFGASDGIAMSNTNYWITSHGYRGVLIEGEPLLYQSLQKNYQGNDQVTLIQELVGFFPADNLDTILSKTHVPTDFDLLSIDIDGNEYHVWEAFQVYRPKVIIIEFNPTIPDGVDFVQEPNLEVKHGNSLESLTKLAKSKRYELVATTFANAFYVDQNYFPLFGISDNSPAVLRADRSAITHLFQGQDGTIFLRGLGHLLWHRIPIREQALQVLPPELRKYPEDYDAVEKQKFDEFRQEYLQQSHVDPSQQRFTLIPASSE
ncbi:MAG: FkbM family methyltransferase [Gemmataceae bacterium]